MPSVYGLAATSVLLNTLPERLLALLSIVPTLEDGLRGVTLTESEEVMVRSYTKGFVVPRAFLTDYSSDYDTAKDVDGLVIADGDVISIIGVNIDYPVMVKLDGQDVAAMIEFIVKSVSLDVLRDLKRVVDDEIVKRHALETEEEV